MEKGGRGGVVDDAKTTGASVKPVFQRETVVGVWDEIYPLLERHWAEIATYKDIPLAPDRSFYESADARGVLRVFTARVDNQLVGYSIFFVTSGNPHYRFTRQADQDIIFIDKERRGFGARFIAWCDEQLKAEDVQVVRHHIKAAHDWSAVLRRQGYELQDFIYARRLDRCP